MQTTFAEIDDRVSEACERELNSPSVTREAVKGGATKVIAGFHLHDKAEEDRLFEAAIGSRRREVETFQQKRDEIVRMCSALGIVPLAVVPSLSWRQICLETELFRLDPDEEGRVAYDQTRFRELHAARRASVEDQLEYLANKDWKAFLKMMFPNYESISTRQQGTTSLLGAAKPYNSYQDAILAAQTQMLTGVLLVSFATHATLVLPTPPADVAAILLKAQSLKLKVAAVADAISFKESPTQLYHNVVAAQEAEERALREDPIIYAEHGVATAIIAQFGDFPIEVEVVERVVRADRLFRHFPAEQIGAR